MADLQLSENSIRVLERRYLKKGTDGSIVETPEGMFRRVATNVAQADKLYDESADLKVIENEFYQVMAGLDFLPNSPTLMNAGRDLQQLSACFVLPVEDSMEEIFETIKHTALIHKSGGGTGFSFSRVRPRNDVVRSTSGVSSGPISFMTVFDAATETIKQGGTRRGANMAILSIDHPDIEDFINAKKDLAKLNNFNISVGLNDQFMEALRENREFHLRNPRDGEVVGARSAKKVFDVIVNNAWESGEPGIIFLDRMNAANPTPHIGKIESTNPCGEQPLLPYESCNLGSINLAHMLKNEEVDWDKLRSVIRTAVHFLDNVIDMNKFPLPQIEANTTANRKIGLGVMGWADMLIRLGIPYNSERALELATEVMGFIDEESKVMSEELAKIRGVFPNFEGSIFDVPGGRRLRNATTTTIAPTGTISMIADVSSGIEPLFALVYTKNVMDKDALLYINGYFEEIMRNQGMYSEDLMKKIAEVGSLKHLERIPEAVSRIFVTAHDITPYWHIQMQGAFQKSVDNAVSKTVNFPKSATREDISEVYQLAHQLGCKGVTVYRDGSRQGQVVTIGKEKKDDASKEAVITEADFRKPRDRALFTKGGTLKMKTGCGNLYVTINEDDEGLFEVFASMGKAGGCASSQSEAISRMVSLALRSHIEPKAVIKQLKGIRCPNPTLWTGGPVYSCPDAMGKAMERYLVAKEENAPVESKTIESFGSSSAGAGQNELPTASDYGSEIPSSQGTSSEPKDEAESTWMVGICPDCGSPLFYEEGCAVCRVCAFSKCG
jgi:ribonucleoside-diphosphate reductase alpha chain